MLCVCLAQCANPFDACISLSLALALTREMKFLCDRWIFSSCSLGSIDFLCNLVWKIPHQKRIPFLSPSSIYKIENGIVCEPIVCANQRAYQTCVHACNGKENRVVWLELIYQKGRSKNRPRANTSGRYKLINSNAVHECVPKFRVYYVNRKFQKCE